MHKLHFNIENHIIQIISKDVLAMKCTRLRRSKRTKNLNNQLTLKIAKKHLHYLCSPVHGEKNQACKKKSLVVLSH